MQVARRLVGRHRQSLFSVRNLTEVSGDVNMSGSTYKLPWAQYSAPFHDREPLINRLAGLFLLRRIASSHGYSFSVSDFLQGVKEAVFSLAGILSTPERQDTLHGILHPRLYDRISPSLASLQNGSRMHLDVESIRQLQLNCVNSVIGATEPGDEHTMSWLGQKVITSRTELRALDEMNTKITFRSGREIALEAANTHMEFQLGVSFKTKEKFAILNSTGEVVMGSNQFRDCYHLWQFSSSVDWSGDIDYPFTWIIADINNHLNTTSH